MEPYLEVAGFFQEQNKPADLQAAIEAAAQVKCERSPPDVFSGRRSGVVGRGFPPRGGVFKVLSSEHPDRSDWPSHAAAREWLGRLYEAQGKPAEAAEQYRASLQLDPGRSQARSRLQKLEKASP